MTGAMSPDLLAPLFIVGFLALVYYHIRSRRY